MYPVTVLSNVLGQLLVFLSDLAVFGLVNVNFSDFFARVLPLTLGAISINCLSLDAQLELDKS